MELYYIIAVTDRDRAGEMAELYQAAGLHLTLTKLGRGTGPARGAVDLRTGRDAEGDRQRRGRRGDAEADLQKREAADADRHSGATA